MLAHELLLLTIIEKKYIVPLDPILNEANISKNYSELGHLLQAVANNNVVFFAHQDLYRIHEISSTTHLDATMYCNPLFIKKWIKRAEGKDNIYSFEHASQNTRNIMIRELDENITYMKKTINSA